MDGADGERGRKPASLYGGFLSLSLSLRVSLKVAESLANRPDADVPTPNNAAVTKDASLDDNLTVIVGPFAFLTSMKCERAHARWLCSSIIILPRYRTPNIVLMPNCVFYDVKAQSVNDKKLGERWRDGRTRIW